MTPALLQHRGFIWRRALLDLRYRYAGSSLGFAWNILHPVLVIVVYSLIFGIIRNRIIEDASVPYAVFLCAGLLPWMAFADTLSRECSCLNANAAYLSKLAVPEQVFLAQTALTATFGLVISFTVLMIISAFVGLTPTWHWLLLPLPLLVLQVIGFGFGQALGALNVFFSDIGQAVPVVLRLAMWCAPVIFPMSFYADHGLSPLLALNPATPVIVAVRDLYIDATLPEPATWLIMLAWAVAAWIIGAVVMHRCGPHLRDEL